MREARNESSDYMEVGIAEMLLFLTWLQLWRLGTWTSSKNPIQTFIILEKIIKMGVYKSILTIVTPEYKKQSSVYFN